MMYPNMPTSSPLGGLSLYVPHTTVLPHTTVSAQT